MSEPYRYYLDCERMRNRNTGIHEYCHRLALALGEAISPREELLCYSHPDSGDLWPGAMGRLRHRGLHKYLSPRLDPPCLWHATYQKSRYLPRQRMPKVLTIHDLNFLYEEKSPVSVQRNLRLIQQNLDRVDAVVAISEFVASDIRSHLKVNNVSLHVIHNGCEFHPGTVEESPRFVPRQPFLFALGPAIPKKNFHVLPALLVGNDYSLIIAGHQDPAYQDLILRTARENGVSSRVHLVGPVTHLEKIWYYQNCAAFAFPSLAEGFGLPVIEAMQYGKRVFLARCTSLPEVGGDSAYYFDNFEPEHMRKVFEEAMGKGGSEEEQRRIQTHAYQFTWPLAAARYLEIYRSMRA